MNTFTAMAKIPLQWINGRLIPVLNTELVDFPSEQWKDIPDYEGIYQLSNHGRVKCLSRYVTYPNVGEIWKQERMLKLKIGYSPQNVIRIEAGLRKGKEQRYFSISRLVYFLFVAPFDISDRKLLVTKKDNDPLNCHYNNLQLKLVSHAKVEGRIRRDNRDILNNNEKPVSQYDEKGIFIKSFDSMAAAAQKEGVAISDIKNACFNKRMHGGKYFWRFDAPLQSIDTSECQPRLTGTERRVQKLSLDGTPLETYASTTMAAKAVGLKGIGNITVACQKNIPIRGYLWRYMDDSSRKKLSKSVNENSNKYVLNAATGRVKKRIQKLTLDGKHLESFESIAAAAKAAQAPHSRITAACENPRLTCKGFCWSYAE